jgi:hypothetical protein
VAHGENREAGEPWPLAHGRRWCRLIPVTDGERGWGIWSRCTPAARGSDFGQWREGKLTMARAPWRQVVGQRGMAWRASSGGGGDRLVAQREVRSTGGAHGGVDGVVLDTLPGTTALLTRWS